MSSTRWRLYITAGFGGSYYQILEVEMMANSAGSDLCVGGTASASSEVNSSNIASFAFDNNASSKWMSASQGAQWLEYTFASTVDIWCYTIQCQSEAVEYGIKTWELQFYDGYNWISVDTRTGVPAWSANEKRTFTVVPDFKFSGGFVVSGKIDFHPSFFAISALGGAAVGGSLSANAMYSMPLSGGIISSGSVSAATGMSIQSYLLMVIGGSLCGAINGSGYITLGGSLGVATLFNMQSTGGAVAGGRFMYELIGDSQLDQTVNTASFTFTNTTAKFTMTEV